jgi:broad specificity phosphatase PhoE
MSKQTIIYLVRHGESESNKQRTIGGHVDSALTEEGKKQAIQTRITLKDIRFDTVYSSDLKRAVHTAEILYGRPIPEAHKLYDLRERSFGSLEGKPEHHYQKGNLKRQKLTHEEGWAFKHVPDMESDHELSMRYIPVLEKIAQSNLGKTILIGAHGSAIRTTIMKLTGYTYKDFPAGSFGNGGYAELAYDKDKGFKVIQINGVKL